ncbi:MAG: aldo/keto reductase [Pseudolabrys sp.]|nr:aldo/keto reductase [Pseudolabrys sp.]MDP2297381.1 aldo/keto reductase [Pseudolabrys sp.]
MPTFGVGTWRMGEDDRMREAEAAALRHGLARGFTLIDTAEMYGDGEAERIVGDAIGPRRADVFITTKVLPQNSSKRGTIAACERSLKRLKTDRIDLYLLHWRGAPPLQETVAAFADLKNAGKILDWGVSNFDIGDMRDLAAVDMAKECAANQVLYNLSRRGIEYDLMPFCRDRDIPIMAYSPIEQGRILTHPGLREVAKRHGASPAQAALAWLLRQDNVVTIPKATTLKHVDDNLAALDLTLTPDDLVTLDKHFPPPNEAEPLDML